MRRFFGVFLLLRFLLFLSPLRAQDDDEEWLSMEGEGITIVGTAETTQSMAVVSREEIEKAHAADIPALLEQILGLG
jgi:outer membrane receptor for ferrienterochelin and colicin